MFIYLIANRVTGKYYIGQHKGRDLKKYLLQKFWEAERRLSRRSRLYASMRKHGRGAFSIHALRSDIQSREELDRTEREFISFLRATNPEYGYNICQGGEGFAGPHSEETRAKMSRVHKKQWADPQARRAHSDTMKKALATPEAWSSKSKAMKRVYATPTTHAQMVESLKKGWYGSKNHCVKTLRGIWDDPQSRARMSAAIKQARWTPEKRLTFASRPRDERGRLLPVL